MSGSSVAISTVADLFKILYPGGVEDTLYDTSDGGELFAFLPKSYDFEGSQWNITGQLNGTRGSNNYLTSKAATGAPDLFTFVVPRTGEDYAHISVECKSIAASRTNRGALRQTLQLAVDSARYTIKRSMASMLWGDGGGALGVIATGGISSAVITLATTSDITRFEKGMVLRAVPTGSTYSSVRTGSLTISKVDRVLGKITCTANVTTGIPACVVGDQLFRDGDSTPFMGVFGWCPKADATRTSTLYGVDRSMDEVRLAGSYVNGAGAPMYDVLEEACAENAFHGGRGNVLFLNTRDYKRLKKELHSFQSIQIPTSKPKISMKAIRFDGPNGEMALISDRDCPQGHALLTHRSAWMLRGLRQLPHFADEDGQQWRMEIGAPNVGAELRCWGNLGCLRWGDNTAIKW